MLPVRPNFLAEKLSLHLFSRDRFCNDKCIIKNPKQTQQKPRPVTKYCILYSVVN